MNSVAKLISAGRWAKNRFDPRVPNYRPPTWPQAHPPLKIAIVGCGIAGLAAGWRLNHLGHDVSLFEAQCRPGGRIYTIDMESIPVEVGAARFSDRHQRSIHWIKKFGLRLEPMYSTRGRLVRLTKSERQISRNVSMLSNHDIHQLVSHQDTWPSQFNSKASLAYKLIFNSIARPTWYRIRGGNARLTNSIADDLAQFITYESPVTKISQTNDEVELSYVKGNVEHCRQFDRCILAVPLLTQSNIAFNPPLSDAKQTHAQNIQMQPSIRFFALVQDRSALVNEGLNGFGCTSDGFEIWQPSYQSSSGHMALVVYAQGEAASSLLDVDAASRGQLLLGVLERMFPGISRKILDSKFYSWGDDPWARGAQTLVDQRDFAIRETLGDPEGRLHFAGEHTSGGWIDDTLESADRVVSEIVSGNVAT